MDMSKYNREKNKWIFEDTFPKKVLGMFVCAKEWLTNGGKKTDVFVLSIEGENYMIMPFNVDFSDMQKKYGDDSDSWNDHNFYLSKNKKGKYVMEAIEESIV